MMMFNINDNYDDIDNMYLHGEEVLGGSLSLLLSLLRCLSPAKSIFIWSCLILSYIILSAPWKDYFILFFIQYILFSSYQIDCGNVRIVLYHEKEIALAFCLISWLFRVRREPEGIGLKAKIWHQIEFCRYIASFYSFSDWIVPLLRPSALSLG